MVGLHIVDYVRNGVTKWYVYAWRGGPRIMVSTVPPVIDQDMLKAQAALLEERDGKGEKGDPTLDDLIADYSASPQYLSKEASTLKDYRLWLNRISEEFGKDALSVFENRKMRGDILEWRDQWAHQPRTADKALVMMSTLLNWGVEHGRLSLNIVSGAKHLHSVNKADEIWEDRHWEAMRASDAKGKPICSKELMDALTLASLTGLRLGDLVRVEWANVGKNAITVITRKKKRRAVIPIYPDLRKHLEARPHREGTILLNSRGKPWTESGLGCVFQKAKPEGFDRTIHDLRGTFATWLAIKGLTDQDIARIIGWTPQRVGEIRARYVDEARVVVSLAERLSQK